MIKVTRLNDQEFVINAELIESVEATPDTMIALTNGKKIMVKNSLDEIIERVEAYKRRSTAPAQAGASSLSSSKQGIAHVG